MTRWLATLGGMFLKLDHSFKATKRIRDVTGQKQYAAILTVMNEYCQVGSTVCTVLVAMHAFCHVCLSRVPTSTCLLAKVPPWLLCLLQVLACLPTQSKSLAEVEPQLRAMFDNYGKLGLQYEDVGCHNAAGLEVST